MCMGGERFDRAKYTASYAFPGMVHLLVHVYMHPVHVHVHVSYILQMYSTHTFTCTSFPTQNRELQIMRRLDHCNIIRLRYFFYSAGDKVHW